MSCYRGCRMPFCLSPAFSSTNFFFHPSLYLFLFYSRYALLHPSSISPSSPLSQLTSLSVTPPPLPFSDSLLLMPLLLRPAPLLFSHHHSLSLPPSPPSILPPADGAWCDGDWLRDSQMEETAGMCFSGEMAVRKDGGPWRDRRENG